MCCVVQLFYFEVLIFLIIFLLEIKEDVCDHQTQIALFLNVAAQDLQ